MNRTEATQIVSYLNRAGLVGAMEGQAAVWADALEDVSFVTAQEVTRGMAKSRTSGQRWVTPGDVRDAVQTARKARTDAMRPADPPAQLDGDVQREKDWTRAYRVAIGDGLDRDGAYRTACSAVGVALPAVVESARPVAQLVARAASNATLPRDVVQGARRDMANEHQSRRGAS